MIENIIKHFITITKHKFVVFKLCIKAGIPVQGIMHDLSKYTPVEFFESAKYYDGTKSPIVFARQDIGYSKAWLHHKGRNKHHYEYWYDNKAPNPMPIIPYKYAVEMVCDTLAAGIVYNGKKWKTNTQLEYWNRTKDRELLNEKIKQFLETVYIQISEKGINEVINKKNLKQIYEQCTNIH